MLCGWSNQELWINKKWSNWILSCLNNQFGGKISVCLLLRIVISIILLLIFFGKLLHQKDFHAQWENEIITPTWWQKLNFLTWDFTISMPEGIDEYSEEARMSDFIRFVNVPYKRFNKTFRISVISDIPRAFSGMGFWDTYVLLEDALKTKLDNSTWIIKNEYKSVDWYNWMEYILLYDLRDQDEAMIILIYGRLILTNEHLYTLEVRYPENSFIEGEYLSFMDSFRFKN